MLSEQDIRRWFDKHVATLTDHGSLQVLEWKEPGTMMYYCRYVFDGNMLYISGDIGDAVFCLTWKAAIHSFDDLYLGYFNSKLSAYSEDKKDFESDVAVKALREWVNRFKDDDIKYDHDEMKELFEHARESSGTSEWAHHVNEHSNFIGDLEPDYWEWMYSCGDVIPARIKSYLIGLKMASEQIRNLEVER